MKAIRAVMVRNCRGISGMTGGETYLLQLLKGFDREKCHCLLVCIVKPSLGETPWLQELKKTGFEYTTIAIENPFNFSDVFQIVRLIRKYKADIVHSLDHRSNLVGLISARITEKPILASFLGWVNFTKGSWRATVYPWIDRLILKRLDAIITDSVAIGKDLEMVENDPPIVAIRNGIDTRWFDPGRELGYFGSEKFTQEGKFVFGIVGRIHPIKGHLNFLKAALGVLEIEPECRFLIVGTVLPGFEYYQQEILDFIDQQNISDSVMIRHVSFKEIPAVFASLDVLVAPSYAESFSFTLLEGMAMEKTVLASNVGGSNEMITDGKTGYLIPVDDIEALTKKMVMLTQNPEKIKEIGKRARQKIIADLGFKAMASRTSDTYQRLIEYKNRSSSLTEAKLWLKERLAEISVK